ncbi:hypothetical protein FGG08_004648 [Glutinoglossum americanum]|uniref:Hydroxysteroid dehydrogenase-like protein 2 n=1 Tax=Glutinoglossum americanum TaxID=1670608 RepID=A0A9P8I577_9PEZI|nr:hypothetical protein FGG08_004648 [Glutinoglossum americanum]
MKGVALVIGASRGIGRQVAVDLARNGYTVVVSAKSTSGAAAVEPFPPDPNSRQSTINTVAREILDAGGDVAAIPVDVRDYGSVRRLVDETVKKYGRLDVLIYNSGAIWWASVEKTPMKRFQLMQRVNPEGLYGAVQASLPYFKVNGWKGRIVVVSPPIYSRFFKGKTAYAMGKVAMSVLTKGLAMDFEREGRTEMAITSIWPAASIESAATGQFIEKDPSNARDLRKPTIFSDAILAILRSPATTVNGLLELDEDFLRKHGGVTDFSKYSVVPGSNPRRIMPDQFPDLRVAEQDDEGMRVDSTVLRRSKI